MKGFLLFQFHIRYAFCCGMIGNGKARAGVLRQHSTLISAASVLYLFCREHVSSCYESVSCAGEVPASNTPDLGLKD